MNSVGTGVREIRIKYDQGIFRVIYITKYLDTIFVLHAFKKKSQKTPNKDLGIARQRLKIVIQEAK